jgi:isoleucyl-tRNA synthetase
MIELNEKIIWSHKEIGQNRFKKWLQQSRDWSLSRNRNFGTPIPIWKTDDGKETIVIGSIKELIELSNTNTNTNINININTNTNTDTDTKTKTKN